MRRTRRPVSGDRRGVAAVEFAIAVPFMLLLMFGLADIVRLVRGHMRVQATAMQIGQIVSQCEKPLNGADELVLDAVAKQLLGTYAENGAQWRLIITAFGKNSKGDADINWSANRSGGAPANGAPALTVVSRGSALPQSGSGTYVMGANKLLYRVEVFASMDRLPLSRAVSVLSAPGTIWSLGGAIRFESVRGEVVLSTRVPNTDSLKATAEKGCLK